MLSVVCIRRDALTTEIARILLLGRERFDHSGVMDSVPSRLRHAPGAAVFYVKWFAQVVLVMVLICSVALLVPSPAFAGLILLVVIAWSSWLLASLFRHMFFPRQTAAVSRKVKPSVGAGTPVVLPDSPTRDVVTEQPSVLQRVKAQKAAAAQQTCSSPLRARLPRESRGRTFPACFVYCRARRRLPAA
jgi:hypothetical protein